MSVFDRVEGIIIDKAAAAVLDMLKNHPGQANRLAEALHEAGLGHLVESWAGPGKKLSISADQIQGILAEEHVARVATRLGVSQQEAAGKIAELLPVVMNGIAKDGRGFVVEHEGH